MIPAAPALDRRPPHRAPGKARPAMRALLLAAALAGPAGLLTACAPVVVGGAAAGTALVATDRRTAGLQLEDQNIAFKVDSRMRQAFGDAANVSSTAYLGRVLLTGQVADEQAKQRATQLAREVENVKEVVNQIEVGPLSTFERRTSDTWISSKVRATLVNTRGVPSRTINVTTDNGVVYLMGKVTRIEGDMAAAAAAGVSGVKKVVKVFTIMTREEEEALAASMKEADRPSREPAPITSPDASQSQPAEAGGSGAGAGVEVMPIQ